MTHLKQTFGLVALGFFLSGCLGEEGAEIVAQWKDTKNDIGLLDPEFGGEDELTERSMEDHCVRAIQEGADQLKDDLRVLGPRETEIAACDSVEISEQGSDIRCGLGVANIQDRDLALEDYNNEELMEKFDSAIKNLLCEIFEVDIERVAKSDLSLSEEALMLVEMKKLLNKSEFNLGTIKFDIQIDENGEIAVLFKEL